MYTTAHSDLFWKVFKVHHKGEQYIKMKILFFYKSTGNICYWLNPEGKPKNHKVISEVKKHWRTY